jgi:hypothetical protein
MFAPGDSFGGRWPGATIMLKSLIRDRETTSPSGRRKHYLMRCPQMKASSVSVFERLDLDKVFRPIPTNIFKPIGGVCPDWLARKLRAALVAA